MIGLFACLAFGQASKEGDAAWQKYFDKIRELLTPHSALPPILDLSQPGARESAQATAAGHAWERKYTGSMLAREITDPGVGPEIGPESISTRIIDYVGRRWAIPAVNCEAVLRVKPVATAAHLAWTNRLVYSTFTLAILEVMKADKKMGITPGGQIRAAEFGGTLRFPSGHLETFFTVGEGFMGLQREYFVFLWKPVRSDNTWMTSEAYLIQDGLVFPIRTEMWTEQELANREKGIPEKDFEGKVKAAIAKNVNADY
ncbi:MAG TPA: hypothetical protein VG345_13140 [Bryobacteraceae bacterium]|nr:hypothetical protein [Bryobacteraceae bacterium]